MNSQGILSLILTTVVPIVLAVIGVLIIASSRRGEASKVFTTAAIAIAGIMFIVGGAGFVAFGQQLSRIVFKG